MIDNKYELFAEAVNNMYKIIVETAKEQNKDDAYMKSLANQIIIMKSTSADDLMNSYRIEMGKYESKRTIHFLKHFKDDPDIDLTNRIRDLYKYIRVIEICVFS